MIERERKLRRAALTITLLVCALPAQSAQLIVEIEGARSDEGMVRVALWDAEATFLGDNEPLLGQAVPVEAGQARLTLDDLPAGDFALSVFHDADDNGKLDTNLMGIPKEAYGFSNNARGRFGPPSFEQCRFELDESGAVQRIELQ